MKKIIVLNHKSYLKYEQIKNYPIDINDYIRTDQTVVICPSSIYIPYFKGKYNFKLGAQSIDYENKTGNILGQVLKSMNVSYALIDENEEKIINLRINEAINNNIKPIVTIGETFYEKELNKTATVINRQIKEYFKEIEIKQDIIICYYPKWSFKGKQVPSITYIEEVIELIKNIIKRKYNVNIKVIYGGDVTKENIQKLDRIKNIDGYLIEEPSKNINELTQMLNMIE